MSSGKLLMCGGSSSTAEEFFESFLCSSRLKEESNRCSKTCSHDYLVREAANLMEAAVISLILTVAFQSCFLPKVPQLIEINTSIDEVSLGPKV